MTALSKFSRIPFFAPSFFALFVFPLITACKFGTDSKPKALESGDWFKDGKDRFYLAALRTNENLEGTSAQAKVGSEMIFGVGCFGESKDASSFVEVPPGPCSDKPRSMRLGDRTYLDEFVFAKDVAKPKRGECMLLLGDANMAEHIKQFPKEYNVGPSGAAWNSAAIAAGSCALSTMIFVPSIRNHALNAVGFAATKTRGVATAATTAVGGAATAVSNQAGNVIRGFQSAPVTQYTALASPQTMSAFNLKIAMYQYQTMAQIRAATPTSYSGLLQKLGAGSTEFARKLGTPAQRFFTSPVGKSVNMGLAVIPCGNIVTSVWNLLSESQTNKNLAAFYKAMASAEKITATDMKAAEWGKRFQQLSNEGKFREAAAIYNPQFIRSFNQKVFGTVEQGWFKGQKFFDTVKELNAQLNEYSNAP